MTRQPGFKSVRMRQTFWFLTVAMIPLIFVVATLYYQRSASIRDIEFEKLQTIRDLKVRELNSWLDERVGDLGVVSGDHEIRAMADITPKKLTERTSEDKETVRIARGLLRRYVDKYNAYRELFIVGAASGKVEVSTSPASEGIDKSKDPYFTEAMRTREVWIKDIYYSKTDGKPGMTFSVPIHRLNDADEIVGVLVARIDLDRSLYALLREFTGFGRTGETLIVNRDVVAVNNLRWRENAPLALKIAAEPAVKAAAGDTGIIETLDYRDEMVLAAYTHIPRTGWGFVAKRDLAEIYAPIQAMVWDMAIILAISALAVFGVAMLLSRAISQPILDISTTVQRVAGGDMEARCSATGSDEIAVLGASFNEMADSLASQRAVLQGGAEIAETMAIAGDIEAFASGLLMKLLDVTDSQLGAFYLRNQDGGLFEPVKSVGLAVDAALVFGADEHEGELGRALASKRTTFIRDIPKNTAFTFKTTAGTATPAEIVTIPLVVKDKVIAVISLATLRTYSSSHRTILIQAQIGMNTALANALSGARTARLAEELHAGNEELASLNEELQNRTEELEHQA
ncbi:MAG: HAMP domain-containing protein, partial [Phycisphaerales bacterium]|nr:HAMP domain-containing protein [Phycisphaerales bacterium]